MRQKRGLWTRELKKDIIGRLSATINPHLPHAAQTTPIQEDRVESDAPWAYDHATAGRRQYPGSYGTRPAISTR
jgi:hypothetical protein